MFAEGLVTAHSKIESDCLASARGDASRLSFHPRGTVRCVGAPLFRNQLARDLGCLLDVDAEIISWSCIPLVLRDHDDTHVPDFVIERAGGLSILDTALSASDCPAAWIEAAALRLGHSYDAVPCDQIRGGFRLLNARDLLRYARWNCPLGDRVRLLAALDENGSMTVAECMPAFRESPPIAGLSSLILHRFVEIDLDDARIGPETQVRRSRG